MAFSRDRDFHDIYPIDLYLNKATGEMLWVYEENSDALMDGGDPEDNALMRKQVNASPENYIAIPGLSHGQHHGILRAFLDSDWTENPGQRSSAKAAYFGSIGAWLKRVDDDTAVQAYYSFRDESIEKMMREFLHDNGIGHFESDL